MPRPTSLREYFKGRQITLTVHLTGTPVGGISPFGRRKPVRAVLEQRALAHELVYLNGGQRGLQLRMKPTDGMM